MPNEWNKALDGLIEGATSISQGIQKKNYRANAENSFNEYKKKIIDAFNLFLNKKTPNPGQPPDLLNNDNAVANSSDVMPDKQVPEQVFNPVAVYSQLLDYKKSMAGNPFGNQYSKNAHDLFNLLFGQNFIKDNITDKKFSPDEFGKMSFNEAKTLGNRQLYDGLMFLNNDVRNKILRTNEIAQKLYRKKTGQKWVDSTTDQ